MAKSLPKSDLEFVRQGVGGLWEKLRGKRLFITGGTGFFGSWLLETLIDADREYGLDVQVIVLTRDPKAFENRAPHLTGAKIIQLHEGDVRSFARPSGHFSHVIHAATEVAKFSQTAPITTMDSIIEGTRQVLNAFRPDSLESFLYVSSGAVYGTQPPDLKGVAEDFPQAPLTTDLSSTYGQSKRLAEHLCGLYWDQDQTPLKIARCFAFIGPYMPFESHLAAGAFIQSALNQQDIHITGDGTTVRSYLYAADLAVWLWSILLAGKPGIPYNVGSDSTVSIRDLALLTQSILHPTGEVHVAKSPLPGALPARYVPAVDRARTELRLLAHTPLDEAIRRTGHWRKQQLDTEMKHP